MRSRVPGLPSSWRRLALLLGVGACTTKVDPATDFQRVNERIAAGTGHALSQSPFGDDRAPSDVKAIFQDGLSLDEALRLALESPAVTASFQRVGIARADVEQAGLLANPSISLLFLFPLSGGSPDVQAGIASSIADLFRIPERRRVAVAGLDATIVEVARFAAEQVADVRVAYFRCIAAEEGRSIERKNIELAQRGVELVLRQVARGVASRVDENSARSRVLDAEIALLHAEADSIEMRRHLATLLGLEIDLTMVALTDRLPEPDSPEIDGERLATLATEKRLDLAAAVALATEAERRVALEQSSRWTNVEVGVAGERPEGATTGDSLLGPSLVITLPVFDNNDAQITRAEFVWRERLADVEARRVTVLNEVRAAADRAASAASAAVFMRDSLLPQAEEAAALAKRAFEIGDTTVLSLLESQRTLLVARRARIESLRDAAVAVSDLERKVGAALPVSPDPRRS